MKFEKCHISFFFLQRAFLFQEIDTVKEWLRQALLIKKATTILSSTYMYTPSNLSLEENKKIVYIIILTNVWKTKGWLGTAGRRINTDWRPSFKRSMTIFTWRFDGLFTWRCSSIQTAYYFYNTFAKHRTRLSILFFSSDFLCQVIASCYLDKDCCIWLIPVSLARKVYRNFSDL